MQDYSEAWELLSKKGETKTMELKYLEEVLEDKLYKEFNEDCGKQFSQREPATIRDFIKWMIIKGYVVKRPSWLDKLEKEARI